MTGSKTLNSPERRGDLGGDMIERRLRSDELLLSVPRELEFELMLVLLLKLDPALTLEFAPGLSSADHRSPLSSILFLNPTSLRSITLV